MNEYNVMMRKVELLDTAMMACIAEKRFSMAAVWAKLGDDLEAKMRDLNIEQTTAIAQPTGNYYSF